jgi:ubiquinone/menaquinone biosynthesis C-methylase UbiE
VTQKQDKDVDHWSRIAREWIAWARTPNHDAFWAYRDAFAEFVGRGKGEALDVGCGEGRVSRELMRCGYRVTALDVVRGLAEAAAQAGSAHAYVVAPVTELPFDDGQFDLVVAYNMLMDVDDVPAAVKEMRRVLRSGGENGDIDCAPACGPWQIRERECRFSLCGEWQLLRTAAL